MFENVFFLNKIYKKRKDLKIKKEEIESLKRFFLIYICIYIIGVYEYKILIIE